MPIRQFPSMHLGQFESFATLADFRTVEPVDLAEAQAPKQEKPKGILGRMRMAVQVYVQRLASDYAAVAKDVAIDSKQRPLKTMVVVAALTGLVLAYKTNPDERKLRTRLAQLRQQMVIIPMPIHSTRADSCLQDYTRLLNEHRLERLDFWFFSLLAERPYGKKSCFYAAHDRTTRDWPWVELWNNFVDIGAFDRFWLLENSFRDCDIREEEFVNQQQQFAQQS